MGTIWVLAIVMAVVGWFVAPLIGGYANQFWRLLVALIGLFGTGFVLLNIQHFWGWPRD